MNRSASRPPAPSCRPHVAFFLATSGHSGVDRVMKNLLGEFSARGFRVDLLRIDGHGPFLEKDLAGVRVVKLGASHVNTAFFPLVRYLLQEKPQAMLTDKTRVSRLALWGRRLTGVETRLVVRMGTTVSNYFAGQSWLKRQTEYQSIRRFYPWADAIAVPSRGAAEDLASISGIPLETIRVIPSPVLGELMARQMETPPEHPWFSAEGPPVILGVGELSANKDYATLVRAFSQVKRVFPCRLLVLGEGRQRQALEALVRELGLEKDVSFPGFVPNPYAFMARAAVFAHCAHYEGAPVVLMEALSAGLPVVSTDCPSGPREILRGGEVGRLVPVEDADALAEALLRTLRTPVDRAFLKAAAAPFTIANSATHYLDALGYETGYPPADDFAHESSLKMG